MSKNPDKVKTITAHISIERSELDDTQRKLEYFNRLLKEARTLAGELASRVMKLKRDIQV